MFRMSRSAVAAALLCVCAAGLVFTSIHASRGKLPRAEALTRVASAQVLVFVPTDNRSRSVEHFDGRPVASSMITPLVVRWRDGEPGNIVVAQTPVPLK